MRGHWKDRYKDRKMNLMYSQGKNINICVSKSFLTLVIN